MGHFILHNENPGENTLVSNYFLDVCMPGANGEFVKVYLWLLRNASLSTASLELSSIADAFNCTENDILRAIRYWNKEGLLQAVFNENNALTELYLLPAVSPAKTPSELTSSGHPSGSASAETASNPAIRTDNRNQEILITSEKRRELSTKEEVVQLLFIAEQYLNKTLSRTEADTLLYFYDELHFSADLMEYLIEYCVSKGSRSMHYIKAVAFSWAEQNITTVEQARLESSTHNKAYYTILKAFGIKNRDPVEEELRYMKLWMNDYGFTLDIIKAACSRTVMSLGKASFPYADSILLNWQKKGVHYFSDIEKLDKDQRQKKAGNTPASPSGTRPSSNKNKFNNFHQRTYNVDELEKQLLK